jgi:hypothetical protein
MSGRSLDLTSFDLDQLLPTSVTSRCLRLISVRHPFTLRARVMLRRLKIRSAGLDGWSPVLSAGTLDHDRIERMVTTDHFEMSRW